MIETELGDYSKAADYLAEGRKLGGLTPHFEDVGPALAQHNYTAVLARLKSTPRSLPMPMEAERQVRYAAVALDQGQDKQARQYLEKAAADSAKTPSQAQHARILLARSALDLATRQPDAKKELADLIAGESKRATVSGPTIDGSAAIHLALAAMLAVRNGEFELARKALDASHALALNQGYYDRAALWRTADCEARFATSRKDRVAV